MSVLPKDRKPKPGMSESTIETTAATSPRSFLAHARLIGGLTLVSRLLGLGREVVAGHYLGTGVVASAFAVAFTIPNLFRKLLGEGALSAAFIPLYAQARKRGATESGETAGDFASGSVNLLAMILVGITIVGEAILGVWMWTRPDDGRADRLLMLQFTAVMLPYVMLVCGGAFLSAILQVHKRFGPPAFAPVLLNVCHIAVLAGGAWWLGLHGREAYSPAVVALQTKLAFLMAVTVLVAGVLQVLILWPALRQSGFRFRPKAAFWTPATKKMLLLSVPVALGAGVLQVSVLLDKLISYTLMQGEDLATGQIITHFTLFGREIAYPMLAGATRRLDFAQLLYQFPLGVFAIALATAIFPHLSADAMEAGREKFKSVLHQGIEATLWEGLPASVGLILIAEPLTRLLFQHGQTTAADATLIARSLCYYASAIWAFSMLQVITRAYYAIHDTTTPLYASIINIVLNLAVEIPLLWWMGEAGMAVGTAVSFSVQAVVMLWMLDRRVGGIGLGGLGRSTAKMLIATGAMALACWAVTRSPVYPTHSGRWAWTLQILQQVTIGAAVYFGACLLLKVNLMSHLRRKR
jgi:putative peptidoglycan lipid II flippase